MERYTSCTVELELFDTTAKLDSTLSASNIQHFSDISNINKGSEIVKIATLEPNRTLLNGSCEMYDDVEDLTKHIGYMSTNYSTTITSTFTINHSSVGMTIKFYEAYPEYLKITYYNGNKIIAEKEFQPTSLIFVAEIEASDYKKVVVEMTSSNRFIRVNNIDYGVALVYGSDLDKKLKTCTITEEIDVTSSELTSNTSQVDIIDMEDMFKITNPQSYYQYLQKRQLFRITETIDEKEVLIANHYLKEWSQEKEHSATFKLQDVIGLMSDTTFYGGIYTNKNAKTLVDEIMNDFGYEDYDASELTNITLTGYIPICTHREALQQVAFACGMCVDTTRSTKIRIYKALYESLGFVDKDRKLVSNNHQIKQEDLTTSIVVSAHNYVLSSENKQQYKGTFEKGEYRITFSKPCQISSVTGASVTKSNCNYADIVVANDGEVIVQGYTYEDQSVEYEKKIKELPSATDENKLQIKDATLVSKNNALEIAELIYYIKEYRLEHQLKIVLDSEKPGNMYSVMITNEYAPLLITKMTTDLTGGYVSNVEGIGYALRIVDSYKAGNELYAGDEGII